MKIKENIHVFIIIGCIFLVVYIFAAVIPLGKELQLTPKWTINFLEKQNIDKNLLLSIDFNRVKYKEDDKSKDKWYERVDVFCKFYIGNIKPFNEVEDFQYFCETCDILKAKKDNSSVISCAGTYGTETIYPYSALPKYHPNFILPLNDLEKLEVLSPSKTDNITPLSKPTFMHFANSGADKLLEENPDIVEDIAGLE